jgi:hypothetical protein
MGRRQVPGGSEAFGDDFASRAGGVAAPCHIGSAMRGKLGRVLARGRPLPGFRRYATITHHGAWLAVDIDELSSPTALVQPAPGGTRPDLRIVGILWRHGRARAAAVA